MDTFIHNNHYTPIGICFRPKLLGKVMKPIPVKYFDTVKKEI